MERRRIVIDEPHHQQELPLDPSPRRRVVIDEAPPSILQVTTDLPQAEKLKEAPIDRAERSSKEALLHMFVKQSGWTEAGWARWYNGLTSWSRERPPSTGYWELRQQSARASDPHNWWYSAELNKWHRGMPQRDSKLAQFIEHATLMQSHEWRGLQSMWPEGYPYDLTRAPFSAKLLTGDTAIIKEPAKIVPSDYPKALPDLNPTRRRVVV